MDLYKKIIVSVLIFLFAFSPLAARRSSAQWITWDPGNFVPNLADNIKDYGLDSLAWTIVNRIIERISASTVKWINSGFKGSPAFVTNPGRFFKNLGDTVAGEFIFNDPALNQLCGPLRNKVKLALTNSYREDRDKRWQCTLSDVTGNFDDFMDDFDRGGWDNFYKVSQQQQNNPIGAYLLAENELFGQISAKTDEANKDLDRGEGFLSFTRCRPGTERTANQSAQSCDAEYNACAANNRGDPNNLKICESTYNRCLSENPPLAVGECSERDKETLTPGSVISDQLGGILRLPGDKLAVADEINEIVSALLNQLMSKILGGGGGLRNVSRPDSTNNNQVFSDDLAKQSLKDSLVGYFCLDDPATDPDPNTCQKPDTPDTSILEQPPFNPNVSPICYDDPATDPDPTTCQRPGTLGSPDNVGQFPINTSGGSGSSGNTCDPADPTCTP